MVTQHIEEDTAICEEKLYVERAKQEVSQAIEGYLEGKLQRPQLLVGSSEDANIVISHALNTLTSIDGIHESDVFYASGNDLVSMADKLQYNPRYFYHLLALRRFVIVQNIEDLEDNMYAQRAFAQIITPANFILLSSAYHSLSIPFWSRALTPKAGRMQNICLHKDECRKQGDISFIMDHIANFYGVQKEELIEKGRIPEKNVPRQTCMYVPRRLGLTFDEIGVTLGRDHSTVLSGYKKVVKGVKTIGDPTALALNAIWPLTEDNGKFKDVVEFFPDQRGTDRKKILASEWSSLVKALKDDKVFHQLEKLVTRYPERFSRSTIERVIAVLKDPQSLSYVFSDIDDYVLYYNLHPQWKNSEMGRNVSLSNQRDVNLERFNDSLAEFVQDVAAGDESYKRDLMNAVIPSTTQAIEN